jgi:hypothetical protein
MSVGASGSGSGASCGGCSAGATCSSGALAQNQLPGGHVPVPAGADCAAANAGTASTSARAAEETMNFAMARDSFRRDSG